MSHRRIQRVQQGFTLMEVMVVIVIIGLMATLVLPNIMGSKQRANIQKTKADISAIENAVEMYHLDHNHFPEEKEGLSALTAEEKNGDNLNGGYVRDLPKDPWGHAYHYANPGQHKDVDIYSSGPDEKIGTADDIGNWTK
ncbi:Type II secretion system protein G [Dickeya dianthicola]|uniref:Type II secretion system core protein G n=1 Tax=Dickeya dianthicola TaxID=204039 RepID=A0AAP6VGZ4_9GAMM|nr:type II secretion system major pseudopilin GspG [Dickeya dianthicola]AYC20041.1 Type II secretion system protein G [Dickeya dianthicola]MBI0437089.1 type II secretion system protein GspG [Dickeya dianthicola]MBI0448623.1 type II secretion system protein GspG [Dickeya dianthicola]MBI0452050.1 type II secretion system protein GspG [Dickeya dianthicola]MBI0456372.1 type II secretion system protein GspG [Dickeya dianthicola]